MSARGDFTNQAAAYARARPPYPGPSVEWALTEAGVGQGDAVVEIGVGTGLFTEHLTGRGLVVTALEPNDAMRAHVPAWPDVRSAPGTFERTGLPDSSQRLAIGAQAFHWADPSTALPELHRILVPGGAFAILFNVRDMADADLVRALRACIDREVPGFAETYRGVDWGAVLTRSGHFRDVTRHEERHVVPMSVDRFLDLWRSHNQLTAAAGPEGLARIIDRMDHVLAGETMVRLGYRCQTWLARRAAVSA